MNDSDRSTAGRDPLEVERLLTDEQRRLTVEHHAAFRRMISTQRTYDAIDQALDEMIEIDPLVSGTNSRRSEKELARILDLIDNLPISENGKDGRH